MMSSLKTAILAFFILIIGVIVLIGVTKYFSEKETPICQDLFKYINNGTGIKLYPNIEQKMVSSYTESNFSWFPYDVQYEKGKLLTEDKLRNRITCEIPVRYCDFRASEIGKVTNTTVRLCVDTVYVVLVDTKEQREWKYGQ